MSYRATVVRYHGKTGNTTIEMDIPDRVTITGKEDHFARAYEDLETALGGMRAMDEALGLGANGDKEPWPIIYRVKSLTSF